MGSNLLGGQILSLSGLLCGRQSVLPPGPYRPERIDNKSVAAAADSISHLLGAKGHCSPAGPLVRSLSVILIYMNQGGRQPSDSSRHFKSSSPAPASSWWTFVRRRPARNSNLKDDDDESICVKSRSSSPVAGDGAQVPSDSGGGCWPAGGGSGPCSSGKLFVLPGPWPPAPGSREEALCKESEFLQRQPVGALSDNNEKEFELEESSRCTRYSPPVVVLTFRFHLTSGRDLKLKLKPIRSPAAII